MSRKQNPCKMPMSSHPCSFATFEKSYKLGLKIHMSMELAAKTALAFSHETVIIPLIIIGYLWIDRKIFFHGICLVLTGMLLNAALKTTFRVPLPPSLSKEWFAFPSGHMQTSIVLYGWLYKFFKNSIIRISIIILLSAIAASLMYFGYHDFFDILGAIFFGLLLMFVYKKLQNKVSERSLFLIIASFSTCSMFYVKLTYKIEPHLWMTYYALFGLLISEYFFGDKSKPMYKKSAKFLATAFCFSALILIKVSFSSIPYTLAFMRSFQWLLVGFCIPFSPFLAHAVCKKA